MIDDGGMEAPVRLEGSGMEMMDETSPPRSGDEDPFLERTAADDVAIFSFCDSGDRSASLRLRMDLMGEAKNFLIDATGDLDTAAVSSTSSSTTDENLHPFFPFKHLLHLVFPSTTSQSFLTVAQ